MSNELLSILLVVGGFIARSLTGPVGLIASGVLAWLARRVKPATPAPVNPANPADPLAPGIPDSPLLRRLGNGPIADMLRSLLFGGMRLEKAEGIIRGHLAETGERVPVEQQVYGSVVTMPASSLAELPSRGALGLTGTFGRYVFEDGRLVRVTNPTPGEGTQTPVAK